MLTPWPLVPLSEVLTRSQESVQLAPQETYRQVTVRMWGKGAGLRNEVKGATIAGERRLLVRAGQLVLSRIDARHGALAIVPPSLDGAIVSNDFPAFAVDSQRLDHRFLGWMCRAPWLWELCRSASEGTTNRVRLVEDRFLSTSVPLPPLNEQRRIVARIEQLAAKIEEAARLRHEGAVLNSAIVTSTARSVLSSLAASITPLRCWLDESRGGIQTGPFGSQLGSGDFQPTGHPIINSGNVRFDGLRREGVRFVSEEKAAQLSRFRLNAGDIVFARMGANTGWCCIVPTEANGWLYNYHLIRVSLDTRRVDPRFINWTLRASPDVEAHLGEKVRGATREGVNSAIIASMPCRVPTLAEQQQISDYLDRLKLAARRAERLLAEAAAELDTLLPAILDRAFKGEL